MSAKSQSYVANSLPSWMRFGAAHNGQIQQWANCTPSDATPRDISIGVAMTSKLLNRFGNNQVVAAKWIQTTVDGANFIYMNQLNVRLVVKDTFFAPASMLSNNPSWNDPSCSMLLQDQLTMLGKWTPPSEQGLWHLFDDCLVDQDGSFSDKKSGMAIQGSLCSMSPHADGTYSNVGISLFLAIPYGIGDMTYRVFAHEAGHTLGAGHPYGETVVVYDGGIMSYGTGHYHCDLGFSPIGKDEVCPVLTSAEETQCAALSVPKTPEGVNMTRAQFLTELPQEPWSVTAAVYTCGWHGWSFSELVVMAALALSLCCCCCMLMGYCCRCSRRACAGSDYTEDELEDEDSEFGSE